MAKKKKSESKVAETISAKTRPLSLRGRVFKGQVVGAKMAKTVIVEQENEISYPKYDRVARSKRRRAVHVPEDINVKEGDFVICSECRKISKTKSAVITEVVTDGKKKS